ncbi:DNA-directed RNA polymerase subunit omega [Heyndrickxia shackletonii]|uniref:DNA-directed RNA polymerase subunit omega n=1 Tax=Heyndrickxia shackletonii TaxID=157838 RepID=A0A0Q3WYV5_9BACI|nr:DNA-directed RNA polymerase subunit omega [Heyndrickxia shackletonii]KQL54685.1 DNA-directed RNA polymerase subunit omega [Heyndrickxia shackletonii]MBB2478724.1 DNA-directed RNA polymerase subunit omega [Bacillus sp. APMAM]NEY98335.1 DNA-directed RNA polymerase subunit omega [Heyndrickxia shackletonii]RTZ57863.1 DNA-directed RNA polymerase subunit omega [Bacillus sp. SAJ1]
MLYPSIDKLLKIIDSKYSLVTVAAKRARNLQDDGGGLLNNFVSQKYVGKALEEIYAKKLVIKTDDENVQG